MKKQILFLISLCIISFSLSGQQYAEYLRSDSLFKDVLILASDSLEGRETGKKGQKMAADYILAQFRSTGLRTGMDTAFLQSFELKEKKAGGAKLSLGGSALQFLDDYYFFSGFDDLEISSDHLFFAGYGIHDSLYSDYQFRDDLRGKILVILDGEPMENGISLITGSETPSSWSTQRKRKADEAARRGALALLILVSDYSTKMESQRHQIEKPSVSIAGSTVATSLPLFFISKNAWNLHSGSTMLNKEFKRGSDRLLPVAFEAKVKKEESRITGENVLVYFKGKRPGTLVLSAHYDHLGISGDKVYNGADDNASGTAGIIAMAKALGRSIQSESWDGRSLLVIAFAGEEKGLLGSSYYTKNPFIPLEDTYANLNTDMIGRVDAHHTNDSNYIYVIGSDHISHDLHELNEKANLKGTKLTLDYKYNDPADINRFYYRSDHYNFARHGIPVIFYFSGVHEDYHKPSDTSEKILPALMEQRVRLAYQTAMELLKFEGPLRKKTM